jgi:glycosyltransferase involved in cell wall biosynthesis
LRGEFSAFITEGGLTSVSMLGYRPLDELLQPHHVFIHPCDREGFGLAPAEAALSGIPVVIAHHAGAAEVLTAAGHVLAIDFGAPLELVSSQILTFAKTVRVVKSEVDELRRRLGTTNYACSVDSAIVAVARHF